VLRTLVKVHGEVTMAIRLAGKIFSLLIWINTLLLRWGTLAVFPLHRAPTALCVRTLLSCPLLPI
jgi:hypothetical protein